MEGVAVLRQAHHLRLRPAWDREGGGRSTAGPARCRRRVRAETAVAKRADLLPRARGIDQPEPLPLDPVADRLEVVRMPVWLQATERSFDLAAVSGLQAGRRPHDGLAGTERRALFVDERAFAQDPVRIRIEGPDSGSRREGGGVDPLTGDPDLVLVDPPGRYTLVVAVLEWSRARGRNRRGARRRGIPRLLGCRDRLPRLDDRGLRTRRNQRRPRSRRRSGSPRTWTCSGSRPTSSGSGATTL